MNKEELSICLACLEEERLKLYELIHFTKDSVAKKVLNEQVVKIERLICKLTKDVER